MISVSRFLSDVVSPGDHLRYERKGPPRPIVVWNCTRQCNLSCVHCYATAVHEKVPGELDTAEAKAFITNVAEFGAPVLLFSGGEPLARKDLFELAEFAKGKGLRLAMSTNGTLIDKEKAKEINRIGFAEVGISLDGIGVNHDKFRGKEGAFDSALTGIRNCVAEGIRVSMRMTITRYNYQDIPAIFKLMEDEQVQRICLYHLAYSGRGSTIQKEDITHEQTRAVMDTICKHTLDINSRGKPKEVLMVDNHADGIYIYLKALKTDPARAEKILALMKTNGGNSSGIRISAVDNMGNVHPDQFWWHYSLGNVKQRKFGEIWEDTSEPLLKGLKDRKGLLKGRCAKCKYLDMCNGNLRVRAEAVYGDVWQQDPACYLTDEEIGVA